jgi:hypothetical protein
MMSSSITNTVWPVVPIPEYMKVLIENFFSAVDDPTEKAGDTLANEVFTPDGVMVSAAGTAVGSAGMYNTPHNLLDP